MNEIKDELLCSAGCEADAFMNEEVRAELFFSLCP